MKTAAKDFKMTELGPIPKDWEVKRLGELCVDYSYGVGAEALDYDGKNKYLRITDIDEASHRFVPNPLTSPSFYSEEHVVKDNDLLVARTGASVGKSYVYSRRDGRLIFAGFLMKANVKDADSRFVFYSTLTDAYKQWVQSESARSGQPGLNLTQLKDYAFPLPPLPEQRKIAAALSNVDEMVAALEKLIEKKRKIKSGAMQRLLTGKTRLPGFKGAWVEKRLGDCAEVFCDGDWIESADQSDVGIRLVQTGNVGEGVFLDKADKKRFISEATFKRLNCCEIFAGDVLVSRLPDPAGRACRLPPSSERRITAVDCTIIRFNDLLAAEYFVAFSQTAGYYKQIDEQMAGSTRQRISRKALGDVVVSCPPTLAEQKAIAKVLGDMDEEIAALEAELAKTRQLKQGMMQELLTGKVRLV